MYGNENYKIVDTENGDFNYLPESEDIETIETTASAFDYEDRIKEAEECLSLADRNAMCTVVAHLAHIVNCHHHSFITNETTEDFAIYQFEQRCPFGQLDVLHHIERPYQILQCLSCADGTEVGIADLQFLCR